MDMQTPRNCYAAETLIAEVHQLFPETGYRLADPDARQTYLTVIFDLASTDAPEDLARLLALVATDERVAEVGRADGDGDGYFVRFISSARTQDLRDSFSLVEAWDIMNEPVPLPEAPPAVIAGFPAGGYQSLGTQDDYTLINDSPITGTDGTTEGEQQ